MNTSAPDLSRCQTLDGFLPLLWDEAAGRAWFRLHAPGEEMLYLGRLTYGVGDWRLQRGNLGRPQIVRFERRGPRLLLVAANPSYRTSSADPAQRASVRQAFAESVLWAFDIAAEDEHGLLVDATAFLLRDGEGIAEELSKLGEGRYTLDRARSALAREGSGAFPRNTQVESILTFANPEATRRPFWFGNAQVEGVAGLVPDPRAVSIRMRNCFVKLPEPGFHPRRFDPRSSFFSSVIFRDFATSLEEPFDTHYALRHRLEKKDPTAAVSDPVHPIVYYLDRAAPEPMRTALLEGGRWWRRAFEAAGFRNAFRLELLPEGADPMDIRYNMINWVPRATRGYSNGKTIWDPRTGEILQGTVTLTAGRDRQLRMIAEALTSPYGDASPSAPVHEMMMARLRQLAAHELGHTIGLDHNHVASTLGADMSVMDYPAPELTLTGNGEVDLSAAYGTAIGKWDEVSIRWGYTQFPPGTTLEAEQKALDRILEDAAEHGLYTMAQQDGAPDTGVHPKAHQWDTGEDAADELHRLLDVRAAALARFGETALKPGRPMALLADVLVPLYLLHRYQTEAAVKLVGGLDFRYALRGDGQMIAEPAGADDQRRGLAAALATISPAVLTLPERLLRLLPPRPPEYPRHRDSFPAHTGLTFDPLAAAEGAATLTLALLLAPARAGRLVEYHQRDAALPDLHEVLEALLNATFRAPDESGLAQAVKLVVEHVALRHLLALAASPEASPLVCAVAGDVIETLAGELATLPADALTRAARRRALAEIAAFREAPERFREPKTLPPPPGTPI